MLRLFIQVVDTRCVSNDHSMRQRSKNLGLDFLQIEMQRKLCQFSLLHVRDAETRYEDTTRQKVHQRNRYGYFAVVHVEAILNSKVDFWCCHFSNQG